MGINPNNYDHITLLDEIDKNQKSITLDSYKITDYKKMLDTQRKLIPVFAAAYAYEIDQETDFDRKVAIATKILEKDNDQSVQQYLKGDKKNLHTCYIVTVRDFDDHKILGFAIFYLKPEYGKDFVWLEHLAIIPSAQGRGLSRNLIFSIVRIYPDTKRILLGVRYENSKAQKIYKHLGFKKIQTHEYGYVLEYKLLSEHKDYYARANAK